MPTSKPKKWSDNIIYDIFLWFFTVVVDLFFREIHPRSSWRVPKTGPVIFVAAPHANQFVDPLNLMRTVRHDAGRRIAFLVAEKSMRRRFVGMMAGLVGSVSVGRALDMKKPTRGKIYLPDPEGDPTLIKGTGTDFTEGDKFQVGGLLVLPSVNNQAANAEIHEVLGPDEIRLKKPFKGDVAVRQLTGKEVKENDGNLVNDDANERQGPQFEGTKFLVAPHIDQGHVYKSVFQRLREGGCIGIFPEGGSHDRTELLPIKAGVAIMALGALAEDPNCDVKIVPVGLNYFHAHKFRSRAVIEFGKPVVADPELVEQYKNGNRREATGALLDQVFKGLQAVTLEAPDYETLMLIQAVRRLYNPKGKKLPLSMVLELNRRLLEGYKRYKDDPRVAGLRKDVLDYNKQLFRLNIRDHQLAYARHRWWWVTLLLFWRVFKLASLSIAVVPGTVLFAPVFIAGKFISIKKSKEALAASTVKIHARDVMATWKILVALALTPILDLFYTCMGTWWTYFNRVGGRVPEWVPLWLVFTAGILFFPAACFMALRFGEVGMDIFKSIRPLMLSLNPSSSNTLVKMRKHREELSQRISDLINELGPELFPDFDAQRIIHDPSHPLYAPEESARSRPGTPTNRRGDSELDTLTFSPTTPPARAARSSTTRRLPRNESFNNIGSIGIFATRPGTPNRSRSRSRTNSESGGNGVVTNGSGSGSGGKMQAMTPIEAGGAKKSKEDMDEVSRDLHRAMRERGRRRRDSEADVWRTGPGDEEDGTSDFEPEEAKKDL